MEPADHQRLARKTWLFVVLVVISNTVGNYCLELGMDPRGEKLVWIAAGVALLIFWTLTRMTLLSWADLSFVLPVTSIGYVLNALLARVALGETLSWERWAGTLLITAGTVLTGLGRLR
ncbi:MAG: hypothetical protein IT162_21755 [Bryobacterales bacterium]|nr:hypothetical protein [Bryobacterales bacterium]